MRKWPVSILSPFFANIHQRSAAKLTRDWHVMSFHTKEFCFSQNFDPKHKIPKNQSEKLNRFHHCQISKFWFFKRALLLSNWFWTDLKMCPQIFLGQITSKKLSLCSWEITKNSFCRKGFKNLHFSTLWFWKFGIFEKRLQVCNEVRDSMGLLQGLMAWTTKSPIRGNNWVPSGCRALLGSVNSLKH